MAFASRSLTETERRYAQVEKEALAVTWACEKLSNYLLEKKFLIKTDHKPLLALLGSKQLDTLPPWVLRFGWRLARFSYDVVHIPGKLLYTADALSRAPLHSTTNNAVLQEKAECIMEVSIESLPMRRETLQLYKQSQTRDPMCSSVINYSRSGWPKVKNQVAPDLRAYWTVRGLLTSV